MVDDAAGPGAPKACDFSAVEVAKLLGVSDSWLYEQVRARTIPCQRYGRKIRFTQTHIDQIRASFEQPAMPPRTPARNGRGGGLR